MADHGDRSDGEPLGYKRPPSWGQFQSGQSGNLKGRPKGTGKKKAGDKAPPELTESEMHLHKLIDETVTLTLNGKRVQVTKREALVLNQFNQAMKGNPLVMRDVAKAIAGIDTKKQVQARAQAEASEQAAQEKAKQDEAWFQHLVELKDKQARAWARAAADGKDEPDKPWPHPDDILVDEAMHTARVRGPYDAKGVPDWEDSRRLRDHYLARYTLALCDERRGEGLVSLIWMMVLYKEDLQLPLRWQATPKLDWEVARRMLMPLRGLRQLVARGAEEFERPQPGLRRSREVYRQQNMMFGPVLKVLGYRSLKQFERACDNSLPATE
jgi:Family of unknown function (DUF5681)